MSNTSLGQNHCSFLYTSSLQVFLFSFTDFYLLSIYTDVLLFVFLITIKLACVCPV